jgi:DNA topoisomerase-1
MARKLGWTRAGTRRPFRYLDAKGRRIRDPEVLERLESLAIPPAWKDVRITPSPRARLQATGLDSAGRRQYRYHPAFRAQQEEAKFERLIRFAEKLPDLRLAMGEHMTLDPLDPLRVCAVSVRLINLAWFRIGSDRHTKRSRTYGVTTLRKSHVSVRGTWVTFRFRAKGKAQVRTAIVDAELAESIRVLLETAGVQLFTYEVEGELRDLKDRRLNDYVKEFMGRGILVQRLPHLGRHPDRCDRLRRTRAGGGKDRAKAGGRGGDAASRSAAGQYAGRRAQRVRVARGRGSVSRRPNDRGLPPP